MPQNPNQKSKKCVRCKKADYTEFSTCRYCGTRYDSVPEKAERTGVDIGALFRSPLFLLSICALTIFVGRPLTDRLTTDAAKQIMKDTRHSFRDANVNLNANPFDAKSLVKRAEANLTLCRPDSAVADYSAAIKIEPHSANLYRKRASAYEAWGKLTEAKKDRDKADSLDTKY
jgi:tetratricopeptide (TPR) repeat protein